WLAGVCFFASGRRHIRWRRDWSSDVCSSDLAQAKARNSRGDFARFRLGLAGWDEVIDQANRFGFWRWHPTPGKNHLLGKGRADRSEERRVGKEDRNRRSPYR